MSLQKITQVTGRGVCVAGNDIDTDRIIPARFLKCVTFDGLGAGLFADDRKAAAASGGVHPLDDPRFRGAAVLLSGANFGCGSSREHAPQAIAKSGFRAVVAESYAEIFFGNSTNLGLPCVSASREDIQRVAAAVTADPALELTVDLTALELRYGAGIIKLSMRDSARDALVNGRWDAIAELLEGLPAVEATTARLPYLRVQV
jgi:3-isopropylmalate/(R)-2-methylmalate dehydratase small subunit